MHTKKVVLSYNLIGRKETTNESPEFIMEEKEFMDKLQNAISDLKDGQREVFLLNRIDKKTYKEISELLSISVKAVEKRMHLALKQLRRKSRKYINVKTKSRVFSKQAVILIKKLKNEKRTYRRYIFISLVK